MSFIGTQQKCKACDKTAHFVDSVSVDGIIYHKTCFKCSQCNGVLAISTYSSVDGVLYCKPHFEQLLRALGVSPGDPYQVSSGKSELTRAPSKLSATFSGTLDKCSSCKKTVYPLERFVIMEGEFYHKSCFRCAQGGCFLSPSNYASLDGFLYCKHHFAQLFKEKGCYSYVSKASSMKKNESQKLELASSVDFEALPTLNHVDEEQQVAK
ncbi:LIM domain-containing protein WLIM2b-like [Prosopis cineraria]|uniref:LIM domain-containing protein WLIM2b-like n=1 Tax=Prosopis cineraria TaxID=364024 RepID=UPI00241060CA|nr:LIM domain-containing protein WLIM2b-like [Prosopis cineraria]